MALDALETDRVGVMRNCLDDAASRCVGDKSILKLLQRDDPLRRSYLQRRWQGRPVLVILSCEAERYNCERAAFSNALGRR